MSEAIDEERRSDAEIARIDRSIAVLKELLRIVEGRKEELSVRLIASRIARHPRTVYRREETLEQLLELVGQKSQRRRP